MQHMNGFSGLLATVDGPVRLLIYGELILFLVILVTGRPLARFRAPLLLLIAGLGCYLYLSGPWPEAAGTIRLALIGITSLPPFALWAVALLFFDDRFRLPIWFWPTALLIGIIAALLDFTGDLEPMLRNVVRFASLAVLAHAIWVMISGLRDDLVQRRRIARIVIVALVLLQASASLITELVLPEVADRQPLEPVAALIILVLTTGLAAALLRPELPAPEAAGMSSPSAGDPDKAKTVQTDPVAEKLDVLVSSGGLYESGLTIAVLANRLGVPEYRLRQTINRQLGYRNFSTFLNHHRIAEAQRRLRDPDMDRLPVLTIAMDLGYGSLGPFNRAFRDATGKTPTEFRRRPDGETLAHS